MLARPVKTFSLSASVCAICIILPRHRKTGMSPFLKGTFLFSASASPSTLRENRRLGRNVSADRRPLRHNAVARDAGERADHAVGADVRIAPDERERVKDGIGADARAGLDV